jgi:response regulator RpfG family c-di-GMP phosphodiesterase
MYAALRAYRDMRTIEANRLGLENVIRASAHVFTRQNSNDFAAAVLSQLFFLAGTEHSALYCTVRRQTDEPPRFVVAAGSGRYQAYAGDPADARLPDTMVRSLLAAYRNQQHQFELDHYVLHFVDSQRNESLLFVGESGNLSPLDHALFELFCTNVSIAFENLHLSGELLSSQLEMVYMLAGAAETRSQETANHVRRVGLLAEMIGHAMELDAAYCETLRYAAPLHDIGKIGIPDPILNKAGPHTPEEAIVMRTHADIGARLLGNSQKPVLQMAAQIAATHHENWDGSGYPQGLAGKDIPIAGRITMVADVFDALGSRRCYKDSWESADIRAFMQSERGRKFDPVVVDHLFACWEQALELRRQLPD